MLQLTDHKETPHLLKSSASVFLLGVTVHFFNRFLSVKIISVRYSRTPLIRINWDGEPFGYAENPDKWILL